MKNEEDDDLEIEKKPRKRTSNSKKGRSIINGPGMGTVEHPEIGDETWFKNKWRPAIAWLYFVLIAFDFIAAPIATPVLSKILTTEFHPWTPLTMMNGGTIHFVFGMLLGIYSWNRTQEKIKTAEGTITKDD